MQKCHTVRIVQYGQKIADGLAVLDAVGGVVMEVDEEILWSGAGGVRALSRSSNGAEFEEEWASENAKITLTGRRAVYVCRRYDKGSWWIGGGLALALTAASKTSAAIRSHKKAVVGQVNYEQLAEVVVNRPPKMVGGWGTVELRSQGDQQRVGLAMPVENVEMVGRALVAAAIRLQAQAGRPDGDDAQHGFLRFGSNTEPESVSNGISRYALVGVDEMSASRDSEITN